MNIKFTNMEEQCSKIEREYPIKNILNYLSDTLGENILIRDVIVINNNNIMLEATSLDTNEDYFIKMSKIDEEHPFVNRIQIIIASSNNTHFIKYMYTCTKDYLGSTICKVVEKYKKDNLWITRDMFGVKVEKENNLQDGKIKIKTR